MELREDATMSSAMKPFWNRSVY